MLFFSVVFLLAVPVTVSACEGDCIVGITNAWLSNYATPIQNVMMDLAIQISNLIPSHPSQDTAMTYLEPLIAAYHNESYHDMEKGIFPSYFHGKCQDANGNEPDGCPNPDCPVVCGTPGSLVHFFPRLRFIAFNQTYHLLQRVSEPGSQAYQQVEEFVVKASHKRPPDERRRRRRSFSRVFSRDVADDLRDHGDDSGSGRFPILPALSRSSSSSPDSGMVVPFNKRTQDIKAGVRSIMDQIHPLLQQECGGSGVENTNGLPKCSWETEMKAYILSFP